MKKVWIVRLTSWSKLVEINCLTTENGSKQISKWQFNSLNVSVNWTFSIKDCDNFGSNKAEQIDLKITLQDNSFFPKLIPFKPFKAILLWRLDRKKRVFSKFSSFCYHSGQFNWNIKWWKSFANRSHVKLGVSVSIV